MYQKSNRNLLMLSKPGFWQADIQRDRRGLECARASAALENEIRPHMILINTMSAFVGTRLDEEIKSGVARLQAENKELRDKLALAEERWVNEIAPQLLAKAELKDDIKIVEVHFEDISADAAKKLTQKLVEEPQAQVTVFYKQKNRLNYILARGAAVSVSCRERIAVLNKELNGHGGGNDNMAQGSSAVSD